MSKDSDFGERLLSGPLVRPLPRDLPPSFVGLRRALKQHAHRVYGLAETEPAEPWLAEIVHQPPLLLLTRDALSLLFPGHAAPTGQAHDWESEDAGPPVADLVREDWRARGLLLDPPAGHHLPGQVLALDLELVARVKAPRPEKD